jgi:hypothetical protein
MLGELTVRFLLGGSIVSLFSLTGDVWKPKTFSGVFGAAPSVALASLALAAHQQGAYEVSLLGRSMILGAVAMYVYSAACVAMSARARWPVWLSALTAWVAWFAVAFGGLRALRAFGLSG